MILAASRGHFLNSRAEHFRLLTQIRGKHRECIEVFCTHCR